MITRIEYASLKDFDFILDGIKDICKIEGEKINNIKFLEKRIKSFIMKKQVICIKYEGKTVGFLEFLFSKKQPYGIDYEDEKKEFCWVNNMFVIKNLRGKGFGKELFKELEKICRKKKINRILLDVFEVNVKSKKFYEEEGFNVKINIMEKKLK